MTHKIVKKQWPGSLWNKNNQMTEFIVIAQTTIEISTSKNLSLRVQKKDSTSLGLNLERNTHRTKGDPLALTVPTKIKNMFEESSKPEIKPDSQEDQTSN